MKLVRKQETKWSEEEGLSKMAIVYGKPNAEAEYKKVEQKANVWHERRRAARKVQTSLLAKAPLSGLKQHMAANPTSKSRAAKGSEADGGARKKGSSLLDQLMGSRTRTRIDPRSLCGPLCGYAWVWSLTRRSGR